MNAVKIDTSLIEKYHGGPYDRLSNESKMFTAIAWDNYPSKAFNTLVENVRQINSQWAGLIKNHGINYLVLAEGDSFCASGFKSNQGIAVDTKEWYVSIGQSKFVATSEDFENEWEQLGELIEDFSSEVCEEVLGLAQDDDFEEDDDFELEKKLKEEEKSETQPETLN